MRILFTYENLVPSPRPDAAQLFHTAAALSARGHEAVVVVPRPPGGGGALGEEVRSHHGLEAAIRVEALPSITFHLAAQHAFHAARVALRAAQLHPDFVYTQSLACASACLAAGQRVLYDSPRPLGDMVPALQPLIVQVTTHPLFLGAVLRSEEALEAHLRIGVPAARLTVVRDDLEADPARRWEARAEAVETFFLARWDEERERVPDEGFEPRRWLEESAAWLRGGLLEGRWAPPPESGDPGEDD